MRDRFIPPGPDPDRPFSIQDNEAVFEISAVPRLLEEGRTIAIDVFYGKPLRATYELTERVITTSVIDWLRANGYTVIEPNAKNEECKHG